MDIKRTRLANGLTFEYVEQGNPSGPAVIFLHGYPDSLKSFEPVLPHLPSAIHAFALTQRGHGNSDRPGEGYTMKDFAADVALFMNHLYLRTAVIVGHSMGATVAQRFALDFPEKTKGLVLIGAFSTFKGNEAMAALYKDILALSDPVDPRFMEDFQASTVVQPLSPAFLQTVVGESLKVPAWALKRILSELLKADYTKELPAVTQPVLLVWGDQDNLTGKKNQDQLLQSLAGARLLEYKGIGHSAHWEEPQRFARDLEAFVMKTG